MSDPDTPRETEPSASLHVDTTELKSGYCNVCNVNSTREEVVLNFGINLDWDRSGSDRIKLQHRIILSPHAAKRVAALLGRVMADYESRFGPLA